MSKKNAVLLNAVLLTVAVLVTGGLFSKTIGEVMLPLTLSSKDILLRVVVSSEALILLALVLALARKTKTKSWPILAILATLAAGMSVVLAGSYSLEVATPESTLLLIVVIGAAFFGSCACESLVHAGSRRGFVLCGAGHTVLLAYAIAILMPS